MSKVFLLILISFSSIASMSDKSRGLIWGSFYGDSFGGPYEFQVPRAHRLTKKNRKLTTAEWNQLETSVQLSDYKIKASSYGPWLDNAAAGTITDDSRHKIIFWECFSKNKRITKKLLANCYIEFSQKNSSYKNWLEQFVYSSWFVVNPQSDKALPPERLWGGIPTMAGQMIFLPLSIIYLNKPKKAYKEAYKLNFIDNGTAKDYTSALVGALSIALKEGATWNDFKTTLITNDPYRYSKVPYVKRDLAKNLKLSLDIVSNSKGVIPKLFSLLESNLKANTWWEADTAFIIAIAVIEFTQKHPKAAFALIRDFGHDTDSYSQLVGAIYGALYGESFFKVNEINLIKSHITKYYGDVLKPFY